MASDSHYADETTDCADTTQAFHEEYVDEGYSDASLTEEGEVSLSPASSLGLDSPTLSFQSPTGLSAEV